METCAAIGAAHAGLSLLEAAEQLGHGLRVDTDAGVPDCDVYHPLLHCRPLRRRCTAITAAAATDAAALAAGAMAGGVLHGNGQHNLPAVCELHRVCQQVGQHLQAEATAVPVDAMGDRMPTVMGSATSGRWRAVPRQATKARCTRTRRQSDRFGSRRVSDMAAVAMGVVSRHWPSS